MNDKLEEWLRRNLNEDSRNVESVSPPPQGNFNKHLHKPKHKFQQTPKDKRTFKKPQLKIIPLGGLDEVGKNMTIFEYEEDIVIVDMGFEFPSEDLLGIDYVIPDVSYLEKNKKRIKGVIITHGHLDHIGGIPYLLPRLDFPPVYGTRLTIGLIEPKIKEFKLEKFAKLRVINPEEFIKLGKFLCSFFRVAHSIPDAVGIVLGTPAGKVVHTGDFKFDETPARNVKKADIHKMEMLGHQNVLALLCESTNALKPGHSISEKEVGETLEGIIQKSKERVIVASFASQIGRLQQLIDAAVKTNRKIFVSGRSMRNNIDVAAKLGYLNFPKTQIEDIKKYKGRKIPDREVLILTTGSQGESVSALTRIADNEHPHIKAKKGDTIIISASPIIGNEKAIGLVTNKLCMLGANVINNQQITDIHSSGHAKQDELARMVNLIRPKYLIPVHGEFFMRKALANLAQEKCNIPEDRIIMIKNGEVLLGEQGKITRSKEIVETKYILIDGAGEGQMGSQIIVDRSIMSQNGALIVILYVSRKGGRMIRKPDVISRGFIYMHESEEVSAEIAALAEKAYGTIKSKNPGARRQDIKSYIRQTIDKYTHAKIERRPLIIPVIIEI